MSSDGGGSVVTAIGGFTGKRRRVIYPTLSVRGQMQDGGTCQIKKSTYRLFLHIDHCLLTFT